MPVDDFQPVPRTLRGSNKTAAKLSADVPIEGMRSVAVRRNFLQLPFNASGKRRSARRGFTLVELVIVGALIALFSSLAIFGVQQQFRSNLKKATIGETRQIATALDFANLDTGIFPRLCWLMESEQGMRFIGSQIVPSGNGVASFVTAEAGGRTPSTTLFDPANQSFGERIATKWDGPYFAASQSRSGVAQGRGGFVYMLIPELPSTGPNNPTEGVGIRWPCDPYNNPYAVYMLDIDRSGSVPFLDFVSATSPSDATRKGNFVNAVVSYGPNHYPGGDEFARGDFGVVPSGNTAPMGAEGSNQFKLRAFKGFVGFRGDRGFITHTALRANEYTRDRANAWSKDFALANIGLFSNGVNGLPSDGQGNGVNSVVCITDPGSDDVVFEF